MTEAILARPEAHALRALASGTATEMEQRLAIACIRQKLCLEDQASFAPGDPTLTAFNEGRRAVGIAIRTAIQRPLTDFPEVDHG